MKVVEGLDALREPSPGAVISIGNFDGVHRGHQGILALARRLRNRFGGELIVATFEPHPLTVLRPEAAPPRLTSPAFKRQLLAEQGVDRLIVLPPTHDVLDTTAEQFWALLRDHLRPAGMVEGANFTFGKGRGGNIQKLRQWTEPSGIELHTPTAVEVALLDLTVTPVSSSLVRWLLAHGRVRDAAICLGRPYVLEGKVIEGYQRGRTIGVPTANVAPEGQMMPLEGVYAGRCTIDGAVYPAAVSIGRAQTFGKDQRHQFEAHLVGFSGDLYGRVIRVEMLDWLREQRKYNGVDPLLAQIKLDIEATRQRAAMTAQRQIASLNA